MNEIYIEGMQFYAFHGCYREEQLVGNKFVVDMWLTVDTEKAAKSDDLSDTVSYLSVYQSVKKEMEITSKLLEHVAERIFTRLFDEFPRIKDIKIKLSKVNPPLGGEVDKVSVIIKKENKNYIL